MKKKTKNLLDKRRTIPERLFFALMFTFLAVWSLLLIYIMFWVITSMLKTNIEYVNTPLALPKVPQFGNLKIAMEKLSYNGSGFIQQLINSLWYAVGGAFIRVFGVCTCGYIFGQYEFKGKKLISSIVIFIMIFPIYGSLPATYKLIHELHLENTYMYVIATCIGGLNADMLIAMGFYSGVPNALREAIYIDGGNDFDAYLRVYFPLGRNIFLALFMLQFIVRWNDYETPLLYLDKIPPLATGLYKFQQEIQYVANNPAYFAGVLIVLLPVLLLFIFFSDKIMGQLYSGGIKG